jgi:DNA-binding LacI/PurR family transcriptional regulator
LNTVSLVVRDSPLVAPDTRVRVQEVIQRLGYHPNASAAALASARTHTLGYLMLGGHQSDTPEVEAVADAFGNQLLNAIITRAQQAGYHVLTTLSSSPALLDSGRIDGALCNWQIPDDVLVQLAARRAPVVVVGRDAGNIPVSWVKADEEGGAYEATRHLLSLGHRRFGLIGVTEARGADRNRNSIPQERVSGYERALMEAAVPVEARYTARGDWTFGSGYVMAKALLSRRPRPTAIFALSEIQSAGALRAAAELGLAVPDDVAIVTTEDSPFVDYLSPRLTAVHVPMYQVGLKATEVLLALLEDRAAPPQHLVLPTRLVMRESSVGAGPDGDPRRFAPTTVDGDQRIDLPDVEVAEGGTGDPN